MRKAKGWKTFKELFSVSIPLIRLLHSNHKNSENYKINMFSLLSEERIQQKHELYDLKSEILDVALRLCGLATACGMARVAENIIFQKTNHVKGDIEVKEKIFFQYRLFEDFLKYRAVIIDKWYQGFRRLPGYCVL